MAEPYPLAVLLDFYGTVVHEDDVYVDEICTSVAGASPLDVSAAEVGSYWWDLFRRLCAQSHGDAFCTQRALERISLQDVLERFRASMDVDRLSDRLYAHWSHPGIFDESVEVSSACGVPICLLSNIDRADLRSALVHNGLYFEHAVTSEECRAYKPRREMFDRALWMLNLTPDEVLHVGDSLSSDVRGAKAAGIRVLWINRRGRLAPDGDDGPDFVADGLRGLLDVVPWAAPRVHLVEVTTDIGIAHVHRLFREYAEGLNVDLGFQGFEQELASLPGVYVPPLGFLQIATFGVQVAGCVAMRAMEGEVCEMKRLYVRPEFRGRGIGRVLAEAVVARARAAGYRRMRLDTLPWMDAAMALYRALGFHEIEPYYDNPIPGTVYMELVL